MDTNVALLSFALIFFNPPKQSIKTRLIRNQFHPKKNNNNNNKKRTAFFHSFGVFRGRKKFIQLNVETQSNEA